MIRDLSELTLGTVLELLYGGIASAVLAGAVLGIAAIYLSVAVRGGRP